MPFACPCCGYLTISDRPPGTFEICPVCGWEDDSAQFTNLSLRGGANGVSLAEARQNFLSFGASTRDACKWNRSPRDDEKP